MTRLPSALLGLLLLAGCQTDAALPRDAATGSGLTVTAIRLDRPLTIPAGSATVRLQFGHTVASNATQETEPYCSFELATVRAAPQPVEPERFEVVRIERRVRDFAGMPVMPRAFVPGLFGGDDEPSQAYFITEFRLRSGPHAQARSLTCQVNALGLPLSGQRYLTLNEMRAALGDYFSFETTR
jgi:hypothetical protein